jgi:hypothetical protein
VKASWFGDENEISQKGYGPGGRIPFAISASRKRPLSSLRHFSDESVDIARISYDRDLVAK